MDDIKNGIKGRVAAWAVEWDGCPAWLKNGTKTLYNWWTLERVHKVVENGVLNRELDLVVLMVRPFPLLSIWKLTRMLLALSHYVCASLTEDKYGVVQRDIHMGRWTSDGLRFRRLRH